MRENEYQQVLNRIVQFRKQMGKTQVDISRDTNLSQAQVCRLESGRNRYQAQTLKEFARQGMDIDYVITGEHRKVGAIEFLIEQNGVTSWEEREQLMRLIVWLLEAGLDRTTEDVPEDKMKNYKKELRQLGQVLDDEEDTVIYKLRSIHALSQLEMSEQLEIGIKKYRKLERGETDIDIELIWNAYRKFRCSPSYLLSGHIENFNMLNEIWTYLDETCRRSITQITKMGLELLQGAKS